MSLKTLIALMESEAEIRKILIAKEALKENKDLLKFKEEYLRLKQQYEKSNEKLHTVVSQKEIKGNEVKNLQLEKESFEILIKSDEISSKKQDKLGEQVKKINERLSSTKIQVVKLKEEEENINKEIVELKKKIHYIKKKYTELKDAQDEQLNSLKMKEDTVEALLKQLCSELGSVFEDMYIKIKKTHNNPIALVENRQCSGCNMELSSFSYESAKFTDDIVRCENCGRLLISEKV